MRGGNFSITLKYQKGDEEHVLLEGFYSGLSAAAALLRHFERRDGRGSPRHDLEGVEVRFLHNTVTPES